MVMQFSDPFEALLNFQKQLEARLASDWLGNSTANMGGYPPINIFQQQDDFVAIVELPGVSKTDLTIEAKEGTLRISGKRSAQACRRTPAFIAASVLPACSIEPSLCR